MLFKTIKGWAAKGKCWMGCFLAEKVLCGVRILRFREETFLVVAPQGYHEVEQLATFLANQMKLESEDGPCYTCRIELSL